MQRVLHGIAWLLSPSLTLGGMPSSPLSNTNSNPPWCKEKEVTPDSYPAPEYKSRTADFRRGIPYPQAAACWSSIWTCATQLCNAQCCWCYVLKPDRIKGFIYKLRLLAITGASWGWCKSHYSTTGRERFIRTLLHKWLETARENNCVDLTPLFLTVKSLCSSLYW